MPLVAGIFKFHLYSFISKLLFMHTRACFQMNMQESLKNKHICVLLIWILSFQKLTLQIDDFFKKRLFLSLPDIFQIVIFKMSRMGISLF